MMRGLGKKKEESITLDFGNKKRRFVLKPEDYEFKKEQKKDYLENNREKLSKIIGTAKEKQIIENVNAKAQAELAEIRKKITKDADSARTSLQERVDEFADEICQKILGRKV